MSTPRRTFASDEKIAILKRHLVDKEPISDLCDGYVTPRDRIDGRHELIHRERDRKLEAGT